MAIAPPVRVPFVWKTDPRAVGSNKDAIALNVMYEPKPNEGGMFTMKRPSTAQVIYDFGAGTGQGMEVFNGTLGAVVSDTFWQVNPPETGSSGAVWQQAASGPWIERSFPQAVVLNGLIYLMGGKTTGVGYLADVWSTPDGYSWSLVNGSAPWGGRAQHACTVLNNTIYFIGGEGAAPAYNDVWSSPDGVTWTALPTAPWEVRTQGVVVAAGNGMFFMGGFNNPGSATVYNDIWFSTDGSTWTQIKPTGNMWDGRYGFALYWFENALYVVGGFNAASVPFNDCWRSTDGGQSWQQLTTFAFPGLNGLGNMGYTIYNKKMWTINGNVGFGVTNNVYSSSDGVTWSLVTTSGPIAANQGGAAVTFRTPTNVSAGRYQTMYYMGGTGSGPGYTIWRAVLDTTVTNPFPLNSDVLNQPCQFNTFVEGSVLLIKNQSGLWVYDGGDIARVTDAGYPVETVPGIVVLGGYAYVMDPSGLIRNCAVDDPYHWPSLNALGADYEDDPGVAIAKYKNYLVAFGTYTMQFFYDAGRNPGSPLLPYLNANIKIGLQPAGQGTSVVSVGDYLVFIGRNKDRRLQVMALADSLSPQVISTTYVEDAIYSYSVKNCFGFAFGKHQFFAVTNGVNETWVFDFMSKEWVKWNYTGRPDFDWVDSVPAPLTSGAWLLDKSTGKVLLINGALADVDGNYSAIVQTDKVDAGNNRTKFWGDLTIIGDRSKARPTLEFSDDDYQTWSAPRFVDMNTSRPILYRNGASRRRAFRYVQTDAEWMRLEALESAIDQGM